MSAPQAIVLFDGVCAVCNHAVQWLLVHDADGALHYAPLQGPTAAALRERHPEIPDQLDSMLVVRLRPEGEQVSWHSTALCELAELLPPPWRAARHLRWVPRPLRDLAYRAFAAVRYELFGKVDHCLLPSEDQAARLLP